ncbi:hypothetical protein KSP39_PZI000796 [Platanthera zijinensis]|uniref:RHOMBOID-like protein n=1 Tax=Platanthera zijinensis TaxID=2320716 RepID=A0AAP0GFJ8_9ASPA
MSNADIEPQNRPRNRKSSGSIAGGEAAAKAPGTVYFDSNSRKERKWTPWIVLVFLAENVVIFVVVMFVNNCPGHSNPYGSCFADVLRRFSFQPLRQNPLLGPSSSTLEKFGALVWDKIVHQHQGWRLVASIWLHAGVIHLLTNMISLVFIGIRLEQQFGFGKIYRFQL